jgi:hypothetical protein
MAPDTLRETIARQETIRRSRDRAWMIFAAFLAAALFLWTMAATSLWGPAGGWTFAVLVYVVIALLATALAARSLLYARRQSRRLAEARAPSSAESRDEPR